MSVKMNTMVIIAIPAALGLVGSFLPAFAAPAMIIGHDGCRMGLSSVT
jgi:hypothetical protein